jgi:hypothetical protein
MHSDSKKRRSFLALLFAADDVRRSILYNYLSKKKIHFVTEIHIFLENHSDAQFDINN